MSLRFVFVKSTLSNVVHVKSFPDISAPVKSTSITLALTKFTFDKSNPSNETPEIIFWSSVGKIPPNSFDGSLILIIPFSIIYSNAFFNSVSVIMPSAQNFMVVFIHSGNISESDCANPGNVIPIKNSADIAIAAPRIT